MTSSVSVPRSNNRSPLHLDNSFSAVNLAALTDPTMMTSDAQLSSSVLAMLGQPVGSEFANSHSYMTGLQGYAAASADDGDDSASSTTNSSPNSSVKLSPASSVPIYSIGPNDLDDAKNITVVPPAMDAADKGPTVSRPRTRSSTGSLSTQRQTRNQTQPQNKSRATKQKQRPQPAAQKVKRTNAQSRSDNGRRNFQPRKRSLERNRIAASKCRQKKREWLSSLEANKCRLEKQYKTLHRECSELLDEVARLKSFLVMHASCNDTKIDGWISLEANTYIRRLSQNMQQQGVDAALAAAAGPTAQANQDTFQGESECLF